MGTIYSGNVAVVSGASSSMKVSTYPTELDAVVSMISCGTFGGGYVFGCDQHLTALDELEKHVAAVRARIHRYRESEAHKG